MPHFGHVPGADLAHLGVHRARVLDVLRQGRGGGFAPRRIEEAFGVGLELLETGLGAEVVGLALVVDGADRVGRRDRHPADRVDHLLGCVPVCGCAWACMVRLLPSDHTPDECGSLTQRALRVDCYRQRFLIIKLNVWIAGTGARVLVGCSVTASQPATAPAAAAAVRPSSVGRNGSVRPGRLSGYMELHLNQADGRHDPGVLDFHRFVLLFTHSFSDRLRFVGELELEHAVVEGLEEGGELELEQAYLDFLVQPVA